ncbi:MAG: hypothetical protein E4G94_01100 [ANME-2 cluster archaeon]|nr:MAG: hypothetical protein E4G94_01100 [ANME-2 cluster archaeon]
MLIYTPENKIEGGVDMENIEFRILKNIRCVHFMGTGDISFDYLISRIMDLHKDPDFDFSFNTFVDFEDATVSLTVGGLEKYQSFFEGLQKARIRRRWAIYSNNKMTLISANVSHFLLAAEIKVDVFEIREQALQYLGITDADLDND